MLKLTGAYGKPPLTDVVSCGEPACTDPFDRVSRDRLSIILALALPIVGGMASQNVLNLVDTAMVGRLGPDALAAVGIGSIASFVSVAFIMGLSSGVQAMAARRLGEGKTVDMAVPLNGGLLVALCLALPLSILLFALTPKLFPILHSDPQVIEQGVPYLQVRLVGMASVGMNFAFRGYFNGVSRSGLYLRTLLVMHGVNIVLNYLLIFGKLGFPELGTTGAAVGTIVATYVGSATYVMLGWRHARDAGFGHRLPSWSTVHTMVRLSVPAGLQQLFMAAGFLTLFWIIGRLGTTQLAAANVLVNLTMVTMLPGLGLGMAAASLVGQALGRGDAEDAHQWAWDVVAVAVAGMVPLGLPMLLAPEVLLGVFTSDVGTIEAARLPLQIVGGSIVLDAVGLVLLNALLGAGDARTVMGVSISLQWGLFLPAAFLVGPWLGHGLVGIWVVQLLQRGAQAGAFATIWHRGRWSSVRV